MAALDSCFVERVGQKIATVAQVSSNVISGTLGVWKTTDKELPFIVISVDERETRLLTIHGVKAFDTFFVDAYMKFENGVLEFDI